jgi:hypothetical protein
MKYIKYISSYTKLNTFYILHLRQNEPHFIFFIPHKMKYILYFSFLEKTKRILYFYFTQNETYFIFLFHAK